MQTLSQPHGRIKAPGSYSQTRIEAVRLATDLSLTWSDRLIAQEIADASRDLYAPDAWTIHRLAEKAGRTA